MTYTLTAEQMQQVREAVAELLLEASQQRGHSFAALGRSRAALVLLDAAMQAPEAMDPLDRPMGGHLLDSVRYPVLPEATAGGDVREAELRGKLDEAEEALFRIRDRAAACGAPHRGFGAIIDMWNEAHIALNALAAAPKPCEPDHGTKPEAPTELCKVCACKFNVPWHDSMNPGWHPFTPTDATTKEKETGR